MASPIPHEALERAVRAAFGARARVVATTPLAGDASSRRYVRLTVTAPGAPATVVAMLLGADRAPMEFEEIGGTAAADELPFVNVARYLAAHGLPVPAIYVDGSRDAGGTAFLLLEDVGDLTLWAAVDATPAETAALFTAAVDLLVTLQLAGARHPDPSCQAFRQRFDGRLARWELEHFVEHGIETRHGRPLPAGERSTLLAALEPLAAPFDTGPLVLAHRDFMAWNLHVRDGELCVIDFQDALLAPDAFDLAQLLTDRTTSTRVPPELERALIARFCDGRAAAGWPVPGDFAARYRACALQHALKVIGRFYFLERVKGKPGYLAYLPAVYAVSRRLFAADPALAPMWQRVAAHVPELAPEAA